MLLLLLLLLCSRHLPIQQPHTGVGWLLACGDRNMANRLLLLLLRWVLLLALGQVRFQHTRKLLALLLLLQLMTCRTLHVCHTPLHPHPRIHTNAHWTTIVHASTSHMAVANCPACFGSNSWAASGCGSCLPQLLQLLCVLCHAVLSHPGAGQAGLLLSFRTAGRQHVHASTHTNGGNRPHAILLLLLKQRSWAVHSTCTQGAASSSSIRHVCHATAGGCQPTASACQARVNELVLPRLYLPHQQHICCHADAARGQQLRRCQITEIPTISSHCIGSSGCCCFSWATVA
jgi:hypothetical protein